MLSFWPAIVTLRRSYAVYWNTAVTVSACAGPFGLNWSRLVTVSPTFTSWICSSPPVPVSTSLPATKHPSGVPQSTSCRLPQGRQIAAGIARDRALAWTVTLPAEEVTAAETPAPDRTETSLAAVMPPPPTPVPSESSSAAEILAPPPACTVPVKALLAVAKVFPAEVSAAVMLPKDRALMSPAVVVMFPVMSPELSTVAPLPAVMAAPELPSSMVTYAPPPAVIESVVSVEPVTFRVASVPALIWVCEMLWALTVTDCGAETWALLTPSTAVRVAVPLVGLVPSPAE